MGPTLEKLMKATWFHVLEESGCYKNIGVGGSRKLKYNL